MTLLRPILASLGQCARCQLNRRDISKLARIQFQSYTTQQSIPLFPTIGVNREEQKRIVKLSPNQPADPKFLKVAIIGCANAGKSTLANRLLGRKFAAVSKKVHTTRHKSKGVLTDGSTQVEFLDTPGLVTPAKMKKHGMERSLLVDPYHTLFEADMIVVVVDVSEVWYRTALDKEVLKALHLHRNKRSVLVLNKVDLLRVKQELLQTTRVLTDGVVGGKRNWQPAAERVKTPRQENLQKMFNKMTTIHKTSGRISDSSSQDDQEKGSKIENSEGSDLNDTSRDMKHFTDEDLRMLRKDWDLYYKELSKIGKAVHRRKGWPGFDRVFMVSSIDGDSVQEVREYLLANALPQQWKYHSVMVTDQDPVQMAKECVKEKLLDHLPQEIPYKMKVVEMLWDVDDDNLLRASFDIVCDTPRHKKLLLGKGGSTIRQIAHEAREALMDAFQRDLTLFLNVTVKEGQ